MSDRKEFHELISPDRAKELIHGLPINPETETVSLDDATGRVTAERITADLDVPGFDRASMDGYAVRAADTVGADEASPIRLEVAGYVHAGETPPQTLDPETTLEISTGAVLPPAADAVVMVERTSRRNDSVDVRTAVAPGDHVMTAGADIGAGGRAIGPGRRLSARDIALLAAIGVEGVTVKCPPRVGVISTGDELVLPGEPLHPESGEIYDVNGTAIGSAIKRAGGTPRVYPPVPDERAAMRAVLQQAASECDLVLSSGSTSASAVDVIYEVIQDRGDVLAHGVAVKPGKPMLIGRLGNGSAYVGLPGYPVSALMVFRQFVAPAIRDAAGLPDNVAATLDARLSQEARFEEGRHRLLPVGLLDTGNATITAYPVDKGSGATTSLTDADGVVEVPADTSFVATDERVTVHRFDPAGRLPTLLAVGDPDPAFDNLLDRVEAPRWLPLEPAHGLRRFTHGPANTFIGPNTSEQPIDGTNIASWTREWGLVVPAGNPDGIDGISTLLEEKYRLANASQNGLRMAIDTVTAEMAAKREIPAEDLRSKIDGYALGRPGIDSPAHQVRRGTVPVGVGLKSTAERLSVGFVSVDNQEVHVWQSMDTVTEGEAQLRDAVDRSLSDILQELPGYQRVS